MSAEAIGSLRRKAQNEQTALALADALRDTERKCDDLRAALIAAMEIVQKERVRIAYNAKGAPPAIEIGYADILHRLDALIAQADAALGREA